MKPAKSILLLLIGLALMNSGCADLRPPAADREVWEGQQKQQQAQTKTAAENDALLNSITAAVWLADFGYVLSCIASHK